MTLIDEQHGASATGGHHESVEDRDLKERIALWLFIAGDGVFFLLQVFSWFYLKGLNVHGMWRGTACSVSAACTLGDGSDLTHIVPKAASWHSLTVAGLVILSAACIWQAEVRARKEQNRGETVAWVSLGLVTLIAGIAVLCLQFTALPFKTISGTYASVFIFFMGSVIAHLCLTLFIGLAVWNRLRRGSANLKWQLQLRLARVWWVWVAFSGAVLALVSTYFA